MSLFGTYGAVKQISYIYMYNKVTQFSKNKEIKKKRPLEKPKKKKNINNSTPKASGELSEPRAYFYV